MKPEDLAAMAKFLNKPEKGVFKRHLIVDWWQGGGLDDKDIFVLAPAIVGEDAGGMMPYNPKGTCVFLKEDRCLVHDAKPFECRELFCGEPVHKGRGTHKAVAMAWNNGAAQKLIVDLLGREPISEKPQSLAEAMGLGF
jgi:Fe-S-cluster containining protein